MERGAWVAQLVTLLTLDFNSGPDLAAHGIELRAGLCAGSLKPAWDSLSLPGSQPLPLLAQGHTSAHTLLK